MTASEATVAWTGERAATLRCRGPSGREVEAPTRRGRGGMRHARLERLEAATVYRCALEADQGSRRLRFRTAPARGGAFTFAAVGDSGDGSREAAALARRIRAGQPAFVIHLGDLAYPEGTAAQLDRRFFRPYRRLLARTPIFPAPGNHDDTRRSAYEAAFGPVYARGERSRGYAFDWAGAHFVSLSSSDLVAGGTVALRLAEDLAGARATPWRIVFLHHPPYSPGRKFVPRGLRATLVPLLEAGHAQLVLAGHEHLYARGELACEHTSGPGVLPVITGGGGRNLDPEASHPNFPRVVSATHYLRVRVSESGIALRAVDLSGKTLDRARLPRGGSRPCRSGGWPAPRER